VSILNKTQHFQIKLFIILNYTVTLRICKIIIYIDLEINILGLVRIYLIIFENFTKFLKLGGVLIIIMVFILIMIILMVFIKTDGLVLLKKIITIFLCF
jgi:hypothetical protein